MSIIPPLKKSGFTLIEIVIVLSIASLILVLVFVAVSGASMARRNDQRRSDARRVLAAVESNPDIYNAFTSTNIDAQVITRSLLGIDSACGFEDPSVTNLAGTPCADNSTSRRVKMRFDFYAGDTVAPQIEIKMNYKCNGNAFSTSSSAGSNAVIAVLEPFSPDGTLRRGTRYCINT